MNDHRDGLATQRFTDGGQFERAAGYSRAVRQGNYISVSGTAAFGPDGVVFPEDSYKQTAEALARALSAAEGLGATRETVLRTRLLLAPGCDWREVVRAHGEVFALHPPANTTYFVAGLIPEGVLVEVEVDAVVSV